MSCGSMIKERNLLFSRQLVFQLSEQDDLKKVAWFKGRRKAGTNLMLQVIQNLGRIYRNSDELVGRNIRHETARENWRASGDGGYKRPNLKVLNWSWLCRNGENIFAARRLLSYKIILNNTCYFNWLFLQPSGRKPRSPGCFNTRGNDESSSISFCGFSFVAR